jgi:hypothetical protein
MNSATEMNAPDLPPFSLDVHSMELGPNTKAVGLELLETESREPLRGRPAAQIWSAAFPALAAKESLVVDFFSHLARVQEFSRLHHVVYRETPSSCLVLPQPSAEQLRLVFERFEKETFGIRVGSMAEKQDAVLEKGLAHRGLDAYQAAYPTYTFCAVCEPQDGWVTLLSEKLWVSEVIRRARPALEPFNVYLARPH